MIIWAFSWLKVNPLETSSRPSLSGGFGRGQKTVDSTGYFLIKFSLSRRQMGHLSCFWKKDKDDKIKLKLPLTKTWDTPRGNCDHRISSNPPWYLLYCCRGRNNLDRMALTWWFSRGSKPRWSNEWHHKTISTRNSHSKRTDSRLPYLHRHSEGFNTSRRFVEHEVSLFWRKIKKIDYRSEPKQALRES